MYTHGEWRREMDLNTTETLTSGVDDAEEEAFLERLRANCTRLPTGSLDRPRVISRQRPAWLAFGIRTLRKLRLIRD
jgi:bifunctional DNA-binding transcriptional regulator/antitoxin component of YhaV-PrlF toxin-antitoxin module